MQGQLPRLPARVRRPPAGSPSPSLPPCAGPERENRPDSHISSPKTEEGRTKGRKIDTVFGFLLPSLPLLRPTTINFPSRSDSAAVRWVQPRSAVGCDSGPPEGRGTERGRRRARSRTRGRTIIQHGSGSKTLRSRSVRPSVRPTTCSLHAGQTCRVSARASCIFGNSCGFHYGEDRKS